MTREEARQAAEVMMAYAEGREVEYYDVIDECWDSSGDLGFNWFDTKYRVKPETKYRPFKDMEECWQEMLKHQPFGWLKNKKNGDVALIGNVCQDKEVLIIWALNRETNYVSDLFNEWFFADGTPFGIKEE